VQHVQHEPHCLKTGLNSRDTDNLGNKSTTRTNNTENCKDEQNVSLQAPGVNSGTREGQSVPASYKTPIVLIIYKVKSDKSLVCDRGKTTST
jgi:hypothetical protein